MSGSGKTSLVRAGLLPALDRGYLPSAGSSWHIAIFRPGSDPVANLSRALVTRRRPGGVGEEDADDIRALLDASSLGLASVARRLLPDTSDCLLVVADQFEEIFRFGRIARSADAHAQATACVDLLINACQQDDVPVYVVLTMRSDYLGDCAHFTGLPEALNDSQFLVPRMTRAQLRAAIECPVAVGGGRISPRLVQRLLYEIDGTSSHNASRADAARQQDQDQLPVLQHALMRMWDVSREARERGEPIDVTHYEQPPVETLRHALDRHAEEVYGGLPTDAPPRRGSSHVSTTDRSRYRESRNASSNPASRADRRRASRRSRRGECRPARRWLTTSSRHSPPRDARLSWLTRSRMLISRTRASSAIGDGSGRGLRRRVGPAAFTRSSQRPPRAGREGRRRSIAVPSSLKLAAGGNRRRRLHSGPAATTQDSRSHSGS